MACDTMVEPAKNPAKTTVLATRAVHELMMSPPFFDLWIEAFIADFRLLAIGRRAPLISPPDPVAARRR
jgi:hypothetical protein